MNGTTKYRLKPWNEVTEHHFITEESWNMLVNTPKLNVAPLGGLMGTSVLISPADSENSLFNTYIVDKDDLYEVEEKISKTTPNPATAETKKYTKNDIRCAGMRVLENITDEDEAIATSIIIAKLINELN